jgi:hypothetical protein
LAGSYITAWGTSAAVSALRNSEPKRIKVNFMQLHVWEFVEFSENGPYLRCLPITHGVREFEKHRRVSISRRGVLAVIRESEITILDTRYAKLPNYRASDGFRSLVKNHSNEPAR